MSSILYIVCIYTGQVRVGSAHCGLAPFVYCMIVVIENGKCLPITAKEIELCECRADGRRWFSKRGYDGTHPLPYGCTKL